MFYSTNRRQTAIVSHDVENDKFVWGNSMVGDATAAEDRVGPVEIVINVAIIAGVSPAVWNYRR